MLDDTMKTQLKGYLERVVRPIEIAARADGSENSREMMALLNDIVPLSDKITLTEHRRVYRRVDIHRLAGIET